MDPGIFVRSIPIGQFRQINHRIFWKKMLGEIVILWVAEVMAPLRTELLGSSHHLSLLHPGKLTAGT